ncbi:hypothetical protein NQ318_001222 [Aromia moschata]|uniref:Uncharacterized protein n=1 Tax=Aromia moschata TaxID=1265417 RepID=A0AAV8ZH87_9CUCU|nr:hypothetical protein NQ318_001222 [Aromia moschata]
MFFNVIVAQITQARQNRRGRVRVFQIPNINLYASYYIDVIDPTVNVTEPSLLAHLSTEDLQCIVSEYLGDKYLFSRLPCHTQAIERTVKLVTEAAFKVCGPEKRDGFIRTTLQSRQRMPSFETKKDFLRILRILGNRSIKQHSWLVGWLGRVWVGLKLQLIFYYRNKAMPPNKQLYIAPLCEDIKQYIVSFILVLNSVEENPKQSVKKRSAQIDISKTHIYRILAENKFKAFKAKIIHTLEVGDDARRLDFCLERSEAYVDMHFHKSIIVSDESTFSPNGVVSSQNCRFWAQENTSRLFQLLLEVKFSKKLQIAFAKDEHQSLET